MHILYILLLFYWKVSQNRRFQRTAAYSVVGSSVLPICYARTDSTFLSFRLVRMCFLLDFHVRRFLADLFSHGAFHRQKNKQRRFRVKMMQLEENNKWLIISSRVLNIHDFVDPRERAGTRACISRGRRHQQMLWQFFCKVSILQKGDRKMQGSWGKKYSTV